MKFERLSSDHWHQEVPGSRWFKADLHVHTIDDLPGKRIKVPAEVGDTGWSENALKSYSRVFLQSAVRLGIQVLGLTPHATKVSDSPETSAVWHIVNAWNTGLDEDGEPFRNKIYAVFPGFEPNINDGGSGVHLLFLFDPEIGRDRYLALFEAIMDAREPWNQNNLRLTQRSAKGIFETIDTRRQETQRTDGQPWDYLVLAPHFQNDHGLLSEVKKQVLETFPCERLAGYELKNNKLPEDFSDSTKPGNFLLPFMRKHRQAFFHASDAYEIGSRGKPSENQLGYRTTWFKMASPRIEALRQAFVANDSRLRIAYERHEDGSLQLLPEPPDPLRGKRPWLRKVTVEGQAAFFGGEEGRKTHIDLSPDLTCIIGGSMTGKSTLLDGLRVLIDAELPSDERLRGDVVARGDGRFLAGSPEIEFDTPGFTVGCPSERWPAVAFTQNELQRLADDPDEVREILARLVPDERNNLLDRKKNLSTLDQELAQHANTLGNLLDERAEAEQRLNTAQQAQKALEAFQKAGLSEMQATEKLQADIDEASRHKDQLRRHMDDLVDILSEAVIDTETESAIQSRLERLGDPLSKETPGLGDLHTQAMEAIKNAQATLLRWIVEIDRTAERIRRAVNLDRQHVEKNLAELGHGPEQLTEFKTLSRRAAKLSRHESEFQSVKEKIEQEVREFEEKHAQRNILVRKQREALDRVKGEVSRQFDDIRVRRVDFGISNSLENFLLEFRQKGITQWWRGLSASERPSPGQLVEKFKAGKLADLGVSPTVGERFIEELTEAKLYRLKALRSGDRYVLELRLDDDEYREANQLSGGKRVSLVLSLLLEAHDDRPLMIDQPEDQLDNRFLWRTVLPALRRLKGRRQVIVATHNANIVVNADADLVIQLEADAEHGRVAVAGAIEDLNVRKAVIETVDGGEKAFELRKTKYGF